MPFKEKKKRRQYMQKYMRDRRSHEAELRKMLKADKEALEKLWAIPKAHELIFGKQKKKKRR